MDDHRVGHEGQRIRRRHPYQIKMIDKYHAFAIFLSDFYLFPSRIIFCTVSTCGAVDISRNLTASSSFSFANCSASSTSESNPHSAALLSLCSMSSQAFLFRVFFLLVFLAYLICGEIGKQLLHRRLLPQQVVQMFLY